MRKLVALQVIFALFPWQGLQAASTILISANTATTVAAAGQAGYYLSSNNTALSTVSFPMYSAGIFSKLRINVLTNTINTGTSTFKFQKNGGNGVGLINIGAGVTGALTDASGTDTVASGDTVAAKIQASGASGSLSINAIACVFTATTNTVTKFVNILNGTFNSFNPTRYQGLNGTDNVSAVTEAWAGHKFRTGGTFKKMGAGVSSNSRTTAVVFKSRKNTADGTQTFSVGAGATGLFVDSSNTDSVVATDVVAIQLTGNSSDFGGFSVMHITSEFETTDNTFQSISHTYAGTLGANITNFSPLSNTLGATTTDLRVPTDLAFTASNFQLQVISNTNGTVTAWLKVNGSNSTLTIGSGGTTGWFEDTNAGHNVSISAGDALNLAYQTNGTTPGLSATQTIAFVGTSAAPSTFLRLGDMNIGGH